MKGKVLSEMGRKDIYRGRSYCEKVDGENIGSWNQKKGGYGYWWIRAVWSKRRKVLPDNEG